MSCDDLSVLGAAPGDRKKLESMGFTTLEQLAMLDKYTLGMGKEKAKP
jgi:predicted RecB family nuclease